MTIFIEISYDTFLDHISIVGIHIYIYYIIIVTLYVQFIGH